MFSHCLRWSGFMFLFSVLRIAAADGDVLRVCADPGNLPFSNHAQEGFEKQDCSLAGAGSWQND